MNGDIRIPMNFPTKTSWSYSVMANAGPEAEQIIPSVVHVIQFGDAGTSTRNAAGADNGRIGSMAELC
jgi:hypothetical protein